MNEEDARKYEQRILQMSQFALRAYVTYDASPIEACDSMFHILASSHMSKEDRLIIAVKAQELAHKLEHMSGVCTCGDQTVH